MDEAASENLLEKRYRTTATIYLVQIVSTVAIIFAAFFLAKNENASDSNVLVPLWVAIVFTAIAAFVLRRVLTRWESLRDVKLLKGFAGLFAALRKNSIILGAMAEAIAIVGLVIAFLSGNKFDALRAGAVALLVFLINFPRKSVWEKIAAGLEKV